MIVLLGLNHRSAPVEIRERLAFDSGGTAEALGRLTGRPGVREAYLLSTCNRVEVLVHGDSAESGLAALRDFLCEERGVEPAELDKFTYHHDGIEAVRHLFRVTCGLDSMILGEPQIAGQVKQAFLAAREAGTIGSVLDRLLQQALSGAKRVRTETGISRHTVSVATTAVELARQIFGELESRKALLLGAGEMSGLVATHLSAQGVNDVVVASRTYNRAEHLAERIGGRAVHWDAALGNLRDVDIVISGTGAPGTVLSKRDVSQALRRRRGRPLFLIDIAVPRDIDPAINRLEYAYLYDIDDLNGVVDKNLDKRNQAAEEARVLLEHECAGFERWLGGLSVAPTITSLRSAFLELGQQEAERFKRKLGASQQQDAELLEQLARSLVQKLLHRPIRHLKGSVDRGDATLSAALYREIFGIDPEIDPGDDATPAPTESPDDDARPAGPRGIVRGGRNDG